MSILSVEDLSAGYGKKEIVSGITLTVKKGQIAGILGPNGCGKSTFLKALCKGISYRGKIMVENQDIHDLSEKKYAKFCSYVPQRSGLSIEISTLEVVLMGFHPYLGLLESPGKDMRKKATEMLSQVGLLEYINTNYMELSEGQKRLCILARSLVADAKLYLLDEPDAALDFQMRDRVLQLVVQKVNAMQGGALCTLHDASLALSYCDCLYLMKQGEIVGAIFPGKDTITDMEQNLSKLYGPVRLVEHTQDNGEQKLLMVHA